MNNQYPMLATLLTSEVIKGNLTVDSIAFEDLRLQVEEMVNDKDMVIEIFINRIMRGVERVETVPEGIRADVEQALSQQTPSITLLVADILDGSKTIDEIPEGVREEVKSETERYLGKKIEWAN